MTHSQSCALAHWRIGRVLMARGRDACDVALANTFGPNTLERFLVRCEAVAPG